MIKIASFLLLLAMISCSKPSSSPNPNQLNENSGLDVLFYNQAIEINGSNVTSDFQDLNLGNIHRNLALKLVVSVENKSSSGSEALSVLWDGANIEFSNNCPISLGARKKCNIELSIPANTLNVGTNLVGFLSVNNQSHAISGSIVAPIIRKSLTVQDVNFGSVEARREKTQRLVISNKGDDIDLVVDQSQISSDFSILKNDCPTILKSRKSCSLDVKVSSLITGSKVGKIKVSEIESNLTANIVDYNPVLNIVPSVSTVDLGSSEGLGIKKFSISYFNHSTSDLNPLSFDMPSFITFEKNTCASSLRSRKSCMATFVVDSSLMSESLNYNIKIKESDVKESFPVSVSYNLSKPTLTASFPQYTSNLSLNAALTTDFANEIKVSDASDCSDGVWIPFNSSIPVTLLNSNSVNNKYFKAKQNNNESDCVSASTTHSVVPSLTATLPQYTTSFNISSTIVSDVADEVKVSNNADCSDGSYVPLVSPMAITISVNNALNTKYFRARKYNIESPCVAASTTHTDVPTIAAILPQYTNSLNVLASLTTNVADEVKFSNNTDCSDGAYVPFSPSLAVSLSTVNALNTKYFKSRKFGFESTCVSATSIHTETPTMVASLPQYTTTLSVNATLSSNVGNEVKVSNNADCSDGSWVPLVSPLSVSLSTVNALNNKYFKSRKYTYESNCVSASSTHTDVPTLFASLPQYTKVLPVSATLTTNVADEIKVSNNADCSDGSYIPLVSPLAVALSTANALNTKYFKARKYTFETGCIPASSTHDNILPAIAFTNANTQDLNQTSASVNYSYTFTQTETNPISAYTYSIYSSTDCYGSPLSSSSGSFSSSASSVPTSLTVRQYRSISVMNTDLAGNVRNQCSHYITYGQPFAVAVPLFASSTKVYNKARQYSGTIRDRFNNLLSGISMTVSSDTDSTTVVSDGGAFNFYISGDMNFDKVANKGIKIKYFDGINDAVDVSVTDTPGVVVSGNIKVIRKSCQEVAAFDEVLTDGTITLDPDQDGAAAEYTAYCDFQAGEGWSLAAKMATSTSSWENTSSRWTTLGGYVNQNTFLPLTSAESKHSAFDLEVFRTIRISDGASKILKADIASSLPSYSLRDLFANVAINSTTALTRTYYDNGLFTYFGHTGSFDLGPGIVNGFEIQTIPMYVNFSSTACSNTASGGVRIGVWAGHSNGCALASLSSAFVGIGGRVAKTGQASLVAGTSSVTNFSSVWVKGVEYRNPTSCADALARNPSLLNVGQRTISIDSDGYLFGTNPSNIECEFSANSAYRQVTSWDNTAAVVQRSGSTLATAAYENRLFVKATFPGVNPTSTGFSPGMGNPANLDIVAMYNMNNPSNNLISNGVRMYVLSNGSNGLFTTGGQGYLFFVRSTNYARNMFINDFGNLSGPADENLNGLLDIAENGDKAQIALFANGRAVWVSTTSNGSGSDVSSYIYVRDLTNETYWLKE